MSPGKAGQAVQIKPPFNTFVFDHDMDGVYHCIQKRMAVFSVWVSVSHSVVRTANWVRTKPKSLDITRFSYQQGSIIIVIIIHSKYFWLVRIPQPTGSVDNILLDLHNSLHHTQPHSVTANVGGFPLKYESFNAQTDFKSISHY